jgi:bacillithiol biosynthesis deacetylase BshB1
MKIDILAFGVHPDDVELSCSGTLLKEIRNGKKVAIVDLTEGELGTRGTVETRYAEATAAAMIMGVHARENLKMRDGFFRIDESHQLKIIQCIRKYKPSIVLANSLEDRHPDHGRAGQLIAESCFLAGLPKILTQHEDGMPQERWRPSYVLHYIQDRLHEPDLVIDISDVFEQRMKAILAYTTQFHSANADANEPQTYISTPGFLEGIIARARLMGKRIGVNFAEGYVSQKSIGIKNLDSLIQNET